MNLLKSFNFLVVIAHAKFREYFIAAVEVDWDYAPYYPWNPIWGRMMKMEEMHSLMPGENRIGRIYKKMQYKQFTDGNFTEEVERPPHEGHLGMLGPIIRGEVGDILNITFWNKGNHPCSMHPHGLRYHADFLADIMEPGEKTVYTWEVLERSGPPPGSKFSSIGWLYHSHAYDVPAEENAGLIGAIIISARGKAREDGSPLDVNREYVQFYSVIDENTSFMAKANAVANDIDIFHSIKLKHDHSGMDHGDMHGMHGGHGGGSMSESDTKMPTTATKNPTTKSPSPYPTLDRTYTQKEKDEYIHTNLMHSINGYVFGNQPNVTMFEGELVRWYVMALGDEPDLHTAHWHGNVVMGEELKWRDVQEILPASMFTMDMIPDALGTWPFHCHVDHHIKMGMTSLYHVFPNPGAMYRTTPNLMMDHDMHAGGNTWLIYANFLVAVSALILGFYILGKLLQLMK